MKETFACTHVIKALVSLVVVLGNVRVMAPGLVVNLPAKDVSETHFLFVS